VKCSINLVDSSFIQHLLCLLGDVYFDHGHDSTSLHQPKVWYHNQLWKVSSLTSLCLLPVTYRNLKITEAVTCFFDPKSAPLFCFNSYCRCSSYLVWFSHSYSSVGSCGMAIFRVLYIKVPNWVKYDFGEFRFQIHLIIHFYMPLF